MLHKLVGNWTSLALGSHPTVSVKWIDSLMVVPTQNPPSQLTLCWQPPQRSQTLSGQGWQILSHLLVPLNQGWNLLPRECEKACCAAVYIIPFLGRQRISVSLAVNPETFMSTNLTLKWIYIFQRSGSPWHIFFLPFVHFSLLFSFVASRTSDSNSSCCFFLISGTGKY